MISGGVYDEYLVPLTDTTLRMCALQVDMLSSRDLDSRPSKRELAAVGEFLESGHVLHIMRDHPYHGVVILGGAWDTILTLGARHRWQKAWVHILADNMTWTERGLRGPDQNILGHVWTAFESPNNTMQHDSYTCQWYKGSVAWPVKRLIEPNNFVGAVIAENMTLDQKCPKECRPLNREDWEYC